MFHLTVITAEQQLFDGQIEALTAPTVVGEIGILMNHHSLMTKLDLGPLKITKEDKSEQLLFISGGYLEVNNNVVTVLADVAENIEQIELEQATEARRKAEQLLKTAQDDTEIDKLLEELRIHAMREKLANIAKFKHSESPRI